MSLPRKREYVNPVVETAGCNPNPNVYYLLVLLIIILHRSPGKMIQQYTKIIILLGRNFFKIING